MDKKTILSDETSVMDRFMNGLSKRLIRELDLAALMHLIPDSKKLRMSIQRIHDWEQQITMLQNKLIKNSLNIKDEKHNNRLNKSINKIKDKIEQEYQKYSLVIGEKNIE